MKRLKLLILFISTSILGCFTTFANAQKTIKISVKDGDMTTAIRSAIENCDADNIKIVLEKGTYFVKPDYAFEKYCAITNHGNGLKKILFPMKGYKSVEIDGNGAKLIHHGQMFPFLFENCNSVTVKNLTVDWDFPFTFLAEVIATNSKEGYRDVKPIRDGFAWKFEKGSFLFPNVDGFNYQYLGSTLPFDKETKRVVAGAVDTHSKPTKIEKLKDGVYRIYEKMRSYPPVGSLLSSKGDRQSDRYAPAFDFKACQNILIENVVVHHALGMGFLFEKSEDIKIINSKVVLEEGSNRVISSTADATHFANCKGDILIDGCRFENMLDDGTNVHGTYLQIAEILDDNTIIVAFKHFEQLGFDFASAGDQMWFIQSPSPNRQSSDTVKKVDVLNEKYTKLTFENKLPKGLKVGDIIESKTYNPTFTMRNCSIGNHRARSVVLKTPLKILIENNTFSSMMSGVLFRGEMFSWYESGAVRDVTIQNNYFKNAADCGTKHAMLYITPRFNSDFDDAIVYDSNIKFINNKIDAFNPRIVIADRVDGLTVTGNEIIRNTENVASFPDAPMYEIVNCKNVVIENNSYKGETPRNVLEADEKSKSTLKFDN